MTLARATYCVSTLTIGLTFALAGCSDAGPGGEPLRRTESPIIVATFTNDKTACEYFVAKGLTRFQAAGIVGNLDQESGVDPTAVQSGGPGRGIAQWSAGGRWDTDSGDNAVAYASQHGQSVYSLDLQLDFIWYELTTFSGYGLTALKNSANVTDATIAFETDFEGCGQCEESQRIAYANAILPDCSPPDYAAEFVSQSFPYATTTMMMDEGQVIPSYIELKNVGTKTWDSSTRLATTAPRDRTSVFADGTWLSGNRLAAVQGTVPPGGTYKFKFDFAAPSAPGTHDEFFGVVQEGVAWFSDSGQGGPPDNQLEAKIEVLATAAPSDAGVAPPPPHKDGGAAAHADAGATSRDDAGVVVGLGGGEADGGAIVGGGADGDIAVSSDGGCSVVVTRRSAPPWTGAAALISAAAVLTSRRRRSRRA
jgi:hypothetical protein